MILKIGQRWINTFLYENGQSSKDIIRLIEITEIVNTSTAKCIVLTSNDTKYPAKNIDTFHSFPIATGVNAWFEYLSGQDSPNDT